MVYLTNTIVWTCVCTSACSPRSRQVFGIRRIPSRSRRRSRGAVRSPLDVQGSSIIALLQLDSYLLDFSNSRDFTNSPIFSIRVS